MWSIAVCDSDAVFAEQLKARMEAFYESRELDVQVQIYPDGKTFNQNVDKPMDLVFINTRLSDMKGYVLAEMIRVCKPEMRIIFLSDCDEDVFDAFRYLPFRYIRKKFWMEELDEALAKLWAIEHKNKCIRIGQRRGHKVIPLSDILYMESRGHYVRIHCVDRIFQIRQKLSEYVEPLQHQYFIQPSKSFLVNCAHIESFDLTVVLKNGEQLNCSKSRRKEARRLHERYLAEITCNM